MQEYNYKEVVYMLKVGKMFVTKVTPHSVEVGLNESLATKYEIYDENDTLQTSRITNLLNRDIKLVKELLDTDSVKVIKRTIATTYEESKGWGEK